MNPFFSSTGGVGIPKDRSEGERATPFGGSESEVSVPPKNHCGEKPSEIS